MCDMDDHDLEPIIGSGAVRDNGIIENYLARRPLRVVHMMRAQDNVIARTLCFLGQCPTFVRTTIASEDSAAIESQRMRNYFAPSKGESSVARILGMNLAREVVKYMTATVAQDYSPVHVGGAKHHHDNVAQDEMDEIAMALESAEAAIADEPHEEASARLHTLKRGRIGQPISFDDGEFVPIYDMQAFPEDSFMDIKRKIYAATGIPIYRQHLIGVSGSALDDSPWSTVMSYTIVGDARYSIDLHELYCAREDSRNIEHTMFGIPIDDAIYESRNTLHVDARDHITMLGQTRPSFMIVVDLAEWIAPRIEKVRASVIDNYQFEILYYGFIVKYFPLMTRDVFTSYLIDEGSMSDHFPDLAPGKTIVSHAMRAQCEISRDTWKSHDIARSLNISHSILHASVTSQPRANDVSSTRAYARDINLRDLFDLIVCSKSIVDVTAHVDSEVQNGSRGETARYVLRKMHKFSELMSVSSTGAQQYARARAPKLGSEPGIVVTFVAHNMTGCPLFMVVRANGNVSFQKNWSQEANVPFDEMVTMFERESQMLIREMRATHVFIISKLEPVTSANIRILDLTVTTVWHNTMNARAFRDMRESWEEYVRAGIIIPKQMSKDELVFVFTRGVSMTDSQQIDRRIAAAGIRESNHYAYLSVAAVRQKWNQSFAGRTVTVEHHATSINFITVDIYEDEYAVFEMYLRAFIDKFTRARHDAQSDVASDTPAEDHSHLRKLRRLQETDPVLYNLKKYGAPRVYSSRCQHPKQPLILTDHEIATHGIPKGAVRYWNFTTQRAAYYMCPNARYPYLNFLTDVHPKGYCIPCCGMMEPPPGSRHAQISRVCLADHSYDVTRMIAKPVGYIMSYGTLDQLHDGRISHLPSGTFSTFINRTLHGVHPGAEAIIHGVAQDVGILRAVSVILDESMSTVTMTIVRGIEKNLINFESLAGGRASTYFASRGAFVGYLTRVASGQEIFPERTWNFMRAVITDCVRDAYNIDLVCIVMPSTGDISRAQLIIPRVFSYGAPRATGLIIAGNGTIHPVITIDPDDFVRHNVILSRALMPQCVAALSNMIRTVDVDGLRAPHMSSSRVIDLEFMQMFVRSHNGNESITIKKLYVGMRGLCYAVLLSPWNAYVPISYSSVTMSRAQTYDISGNSLLDSVCASACKTAILSLNEYIEKTHAPFRALSIDGYITVATNIVGYVVSSGAQSRMLAYFDKLDTREDEYDVIMSLMTDPRKYASSADSTRSATLDISERAERALYPYYEYELFCAQFVARCGTMRNQEVRDRIRAIISRTTKRADMSLISSKVERLRREVGLTNSDITTIMTAISSRELPTEQLDIDLAPLYDAINKPRAHLNKWVADIMRGFTVQESQVPRADRKLLVPKFITPCIGQREYGDAHCDANGHTILRTPVSRLIDILTSDLRNPIKRSYIFARNATPESRAVFTDFVQRPGEILVVKKVATSSRQ